MLSKKLVSAKYINRLSPVARKIHSKSVQQQGANSAKLYIKRISQQSVKFRKWNTVASNQQQQRKDYQRLQVIRHQRARALD